MIWGLRAFFPTLAAKSRKLVSRYVRPVGILLAFLPFRAAVVLWCPRHFGSGHSLLTLTSGAIRGLRMG